MPTKRKPRDGSLQFWPRKRAKRETPRVRSWANVSESKLLGFPGYKVGMTHVIATDKKAKAKDDISIPATLIECPPIKTDSVVFYKDTPYGKKVAFSISSSNPDKELKRKLSVPKNIKKKLEEVKPEDFDDLRIKVYTQPKLTTIGKKKPEIFEIALGGKKEDKLAWAKENLGKEVKVQDVFKDGQQLDSHAVTKGKGLQGALKRYGLGLKSHKSEKSRRKAVLAAEGDKKVQYYAHQSGQMGYHQRLQHNLWVMKINEDPEEVNRTGGFNGYGIAKNTCMVIKGSIQGPAKRMILLTESIRPNKKISKEAPEINHISK